MSVRPVHRYMRLVQCPACRDRYMEEGEETCWECRPEALAGLTGEELAAERERLGAAVRRLHAARLAAEDAAGSLGSMFGMGFAPEGSAPPAAGRTFGPPEPEPVPTYAAPHEAFTLEQLEGRRRRAQDRPASPEERPWRAVEAIGTGGVLLAVGAVSLIVMLLAIALMALVAAAAAGLVLWLTWRILRTLRDR